MLESISHIALTTKDPARTAALFHDLFDAGSIEREDGEGHLETFLRLGGVWIVLVGAPVHRARTGDQIAFHATLEILEATARRLQAMGHDFITRESLGASVVAAPNFSLERTLKVEASGLDERNQDYALASRCKRGGLTARLGR